MNLLYGDIVEIFWQDGMRMGKVRVAGALKNIPLELLTDVQSGDTVLLCDGVAISKVMSSADSKIDNVPRDSRQVD
jgi:hydrogenase maturation factor